MSQFGQQEPGRTATKEDANDAIKKIREKICQIYGQNIAERVIIQYGGSMKPSNAKELLETTDIDGGLIRRCQLKGRGLCSYSEL